MARAEALKAEVAALKVADIDMEEVKAMFNSRCSHCHSQNGASPQPERDLRRLAAAFPRGVAAGERYIPASMKAIDQ